jgi:hypothetical protein
LKHYSVRIDLATGSFLEGELCVTEGDLVVRDSSLRQPPFRMTEKGGALSVILSAAKNLFPQMPAKAVTQRSPAGKEVKSKMDLVNSYAGLSIVRRALRN